MSVTSIAYAVSPALLRKLRADNERFAWLFGEEVEGEGPDAKAKAGPEWKVPTLDFIDFEDTHRLLKCAGYPTFNQVLDFEQGSDEAYDYNGYDIRVATPAKVKKIAGELTKVTLEEVRTKGLEAEFHTDRRYVLLKADDYDAQFEEIERARDFFVAAANAGHAVVAAAC